MTTDPYNPETRRLFADPQHVGDAADTHAARAEAEVAESADGARLRLSAGVENGEIAEMRFRAFGCPHLVAAAEMACARCEGRPIRALEDLDVEEYVTILGVPVEKTGRILLLEDALKSLGKQLSADEPQ